MPYPGTWQARTHRQLCSRLRGKCQDHVATRPSRGGKDSIEMVHVLETKTPSGEAQMWIDILETSEEKRSFTKRPPRYEGPVYMFIVEKYERSNSASSISLCKVILMGGAPIFFLQEHSSDRSHQI